MEITLHFHIAVGVTFEITTHLVPTALHLNSVMLFYFALGDSGFTFREF
jgi:hypothetical protein